MATFPHVQLAWTESTTDLTDFLRYNVYRRESGTTAWTKIAKLHSRALTSYSDYEVRSGVTYEYAVTESSDVFGVELESAFPPPVQAIMTFQGTWLHVLDEPAYYAEIPGVSKNVTADQDVQFVQVWSAQKPVAHVGEMQALRWTLNFRWAWGEQRWEQLAAIQSKQRTDGAVLFYRDRRGVGLYCTMANLQRTDQQGPLFNGSVELREIFYMSPIT